eukprot:RCo003483
MRRSLGCAREQYCLRTGLRKKTWEVFPALPKGGHVRRGFTEGLQMLTGREASTFHRTENLWSSEVRDARTEQPRCMSESKGLPDSMFLGSLLCSNQIEAERRASATQSCCKREKERQACGTEKLLDKVARPTEHHVCPPGITTNVVQALYVRAPPSKQKTLQMFHLLAIAGREGGDEPPTHSSTQAKYKVQNVPQRNTTTTIETKLGNSPKRHTGSCPLVQSVVTPFPSPPGSRLGRAQHHPTTEPPPTPTCIPFRPPKGQGTYEASTGNKTSTTKTMVYFRTGCPWEGDQAERRVFERMGSAGAAQVGLGEATPQPPQHLAKCVQQRLHQHGLGQHRLRPCAEALLAVHRRS